jgi:prevent-host-death family protein
MNVTQLRANIFKVFEKVDRTGQPVEVKLKGKRFRIVPLDPTDKFAGLEPHADCIVGDPEKFDKVDWLKEWRP